MTFQSLLPRSSSKFEKALEEVCRFSPELRAASLRVGNIRAERPKEALPFLIWELGLEPILPYITDLEKAIDDGARWQQIRGTPAAVTLALSWVGKHAYIEADPIGWRWDEYQLVLDDEETDHGALEAILNLTKLSEAAHTRCIRVHDEYDRRSCVVNQSFVNGPCFVNDWSGVWHDLGPKVSFARDDKNFTDFESEIGAGIFGDLYFAAWTNIGLEEDDGRRCQGPLPDDVCAVNQSDVNGPHRVNSVVESGGYRDCPQRWFSISVPVYAELVIFSDLHLIDLGSGDETWDTNLAWDDCDFAWGESAGRTLVSFPATTAQSPLLLNDLGQLTSKTFVASNIENNTDFDHLKNTAGQAHILFGGNIEFTQLASQTKEGTPWNSIQTSWGDMNRPWEIPADVSGLRSDLLLDGEIPLAHTALGDIKGFGAAVAEMAACTAFIGFGGAGLCGQSVVGRSVLGDFRSSASLESINPDDTRWKNMERSWDDCDFDWDNARL